MSKSGIPQTLRTVCIRNLSVLCLHLASRNQNRLALTSQLKFLWHLWFFFSNATQVKSRGLISNDSCHLRAKRWPDSATHTKQNARKWEEGEKHARWELKTISHPYPLPRLAPRSPPQQSLCGYPLLADSVDRRDEKPSPGDGRREYRDP